MADFQFPMEQSVDVQQNVESKLPLVTVIVKLYHDLTALYNC